MFLICIHGWGGGHVQSLRYAKKRKAALQKKEAESRKRWPQRANLSYSSIHCDIYEIGGRNFSSAFFKGVTI
jgi:hypothetical protein